VSAFPGSLSLAVPSSAAFFFGYDFLRFGAFGEILLRRASSDFDGGSCLLSGLFLVFSSYFLLHGDFPSLPQIFGVLECPSGRDSSTPTEQIQPRTRRCLFRLAIFDPGLPI
jgi:hypothetical protein